MNDYNSRHGALLSKYHKFKLRLDKAIKNGSFSKFTYKKRQMLLKRLERLKRQIETLGLQWKVGVTGAMTVAALAMSSPEAQAQDALKLNSLELQANTDSVSSKGASDIATDTLGNYVIVWESEQDGSGKGIYGQRYNSFGSTVGDEFLVNQTTTGDQTNPVVAMDADGDFVVAWELSSNGTGQIVFARQFDEMGVGGSEFVVPATDLAANPTVAMDLDGDFVVAWDEYYQYDNGSGSMYERREVNVVGYDSTGATSFSHQVNGGSNFNLNPAVAMDADGDFVVAWSTGYDIGGSNESYDGILVQRYDKMGNAQGSSTAANGYMSYIDRKNPVASMDSTGNFVVAWDETQRQTGASNVVFQRFESSGMTLGGQITPTDDASGANRSTPDITLNSNGQILLAWKSGGNIAAQRFDAPTGDEFENEFIPNINSFSGDRISPSVATDANGNFIIAWTDIEEDDVKSRKVSVGTATAPLNITASPSNILDNSQPGSYVATLIGTDIDVDSLTYELVSGIGDEDNGDFTIEGDKLKANSLIDFETKSSYAIRVKVTDKFSLTFEKAIALTVEDLSDGSGFIGANEFSASTCSTCVQKNASIASDDVGNFVVAWNVLDGGASEIYARRFASDGSALGTEFLVSDSGASGVKSDPAVAMDKDGDFVLTWHSIGQENSGSSNDFGVYARRYNSAGTAAGSEFQVNSTTNGDQKNPDIAMDTLGNFVIAWESENQDGEGQGIYAAVFANAGGTTKSEFLVNTHTTNDQKSPAAAMDGDGDFVITWQSEGQNDSIDIYAQRFNAAGTAQGSEFLVNTETSYVQQNPAIAMDVDGDFIVIWEDLLQDGNEEGLFAQRFNSAGTKSGIEFQVNFVVEGAQTNPSVEMDSAGNFVVVYDHEGFAAYTQSYLSNGTPIGAAVANFSLIKGIELPVVTVDQLMGYSVAWVLKSKVKARRYTFNSAPVVLNAIMDQTATEGVNYDFTFTTDVFADVDVPFTYSTSLSNGDTIPGWLTFDPMTRNFNGTPQDSDYGKLNIKLSAADTLGAIGSDEFVIEVDFASAITFSGGVWSNGTGPGPGDNAVVMGDYTGNGITAKNLAVEDGGSVTINASGSDSTMVVNGDVFIEGDVTIESGASLVNYGDIKGDGSFTVNRESTFDVAVGKYSFLGSPVQEGNLGNLGNIVYQYNETKAFQGAVNGGLQRWESLPDSVLVSGRGYASAFTGSVSFEGIPNTDTVTVAITYTDDAVADDNFEGFNLVANPYPCAISFDKFMDENSLTNGGDIDGTIWIWDDKGSNNGRGSNTDYITVNSIGMVGAGSSTNGNTWNGNLGTSQGFFVMVDASKSYGSHEVIFTDSMKVINQNSDGSFFRKGGSEDKRLVRLVIRTEENHNSETLIGFISDANSGFDGRYDARKLPGNEFLNLYTLIAENQYAIQGLPFSTGNQNKVLLGFQTQEGGSFTISASELSESLKGKGYLVDSYLGKVIDLSKQGYTFETAAGTFDDRFTLEIMSTEGIVGDIENVSIYGTEEGLGLSLGSEIEGSTEVTLYDLQGNILASAILEAGQSTWSYSKKGIAQVVIVKVQTDKGVKAEKFVID